MEYSDLIHIREATTACQAWDLLENYHEKATLTSEVFLLKRIYSLRLVDGGNMEEHTNAMLNLVNKLTAFGESLIEKLVVAILLMGSPDSYSTIITALESRPEDELTLDLVKGKLIDESRRRRASEEKVSSKETAMKVTGSRSAAKQEIKSFFCKKPWKPGCRKYQL